MTPIEVGQVYQGRVNRRLLVAVARVEGRVVTIVAKGPGQSVRQERVELGRFIRLFRRADIDPPLPVGGPRSSRRRQPVSLNVVVTSAPAPRFGGDPGPPPSSPAVAARGVDAPDTSE